MHKPSKSGDPSDPVARFGAVFAPVWRGIKPLVDLPQGREVGFWAEICLCRQRSLPKGGASIAPGCTPRKSSGRCPLPRSGKKEGESMKTERFNLRMTKQEKEKIRKKAEKAHKPMAEFMIDMALEREIVVIEGLPEIIRELKAIGNNLNQLTLLAHQGKIRTMNFRNFTEQVADIYVEICDLAKRIS